MQDLKRNNKNNFQETRREIRFHKSLLRKRILAHVHRNPAASALGGRGRRVNVMNISKKKRKKMSASTIYEMNRSPSSSSSSEYSKKAWNLRRLLHVSTR